MSERSSPVIRQKIQDWLKNQGYPLEMRAAQAFLKRGWHLHHSRRYKDPITGKDREIDLLAFDYHDDPRTPSGRPVPREDRRIIGNAVIECKWSPEKPWVMFAATMRSTTSLGHLGSMPMTASAQSATSKLTDDDTRNLPLFADREEGYMLVQARLGDTGKGDQDVPNAAYTAVMGATNAADYFSARMGERTTHPIVYVPTIVVEGDLFRCSLDEDGDAVLTEIEMGFLLHHTAEGIRGVQVLRESALARFVDIFQETFAAMEFVLRG